MFQDNSVSQASVQDQPEQYFQKGDGAERLKELSQFLGSYKCRQCKIQPPGNLFLLIQRVNEKYLFCEGCEPQGAEKNLLLLSQRKAKNETIIYNNIADHECQDKQVQVLDRFCYDCQQFACHQCPHNGHQIKKFTDLVNTQYVEPIFFIQGSQKIEKVVNDKVNVLKTKNKKIGDDFTTDLSNQPHEFQDFTLCDERDRKYQQDQLQENQKKCTDRIQGLKNELKKVDDATKLLFEYFEESKQNNLFHMITRDDQYNQRSVIAKLDGVLADVEMKKKEKLEITETKFIIDHDKLDQLCKELVEKPQYEIVYDEVI